MESFGFLIYILVLIEKNLTIETIPVILFSWGKIMKTFHINNLFLDKPKQFGDILVYQIGVLQSNDKIVWDTHAHSNFFELTVIIDGIAEITANGVSLSLSKGEIFLSFPFDTHKIVSTSADPLQYYFLAFDTVNEQFRFQLEKIARQFPTIENRQFKNKEIVSFLSQAIYETTGNNAFNEEYCSVLLCGIVIQIIRQFYSRESNLRLPTKSQTFAYSIMNYINTHIYTMQSLAELSKEFGYDYSHISKIFSKTTKQSLTHYYRFQRLETARSLLSNGMSVSETAKNLNYSSVYSFSVAFKKNYGLSPLKYKQTCRMNPPTQIKK